MCIEDLQVRNMSKAAAGTTEAPGRNVRAKSRLNKSILNQGWFEFHRQLDYKLNWRGGILIAVPPHHTSRTGRGRKAKTKPASAKQESTDATMCEVTYA